MLLGTLELSRNGLKRGDEGQYAFDTDPFVAPTALTAFQSAAGRYGHDYTNMPVSQSL